MVRRLVSAYTVCYLMGRSIQLWESRQCVCVCVCGPPEEVRHCKENSFEVSLAEAQVS